MEKTYLLKVSTSALVVIGDHLKRGVYNDVAGLLQDLQGQVNQIDHEAERSALQDQVTRMGLTLVTESEAKSA